LTLQELAAETEYKPDLAHIQRIEVGGIKRPDRETLEVVLAALDADFTDRRSVLEAFGYKVPASLPTEREIEEARALCRRELDVATYPAYLVDDGQRIHEWNRYTPRLLGLDPDDPAQVRFRGVTIVDLAFNPAYGTSRLIDNPEDYLRAELHFIKAALQPYEGTPRYTQLVSEWRQLPGFADMWDSLGPIVAERSVSHPVVPLKIRVPDIGVLQFRLSSSPLGDPRFQVIHYLPHGAATLRQCALWAEEEGAV
jgi:PAS domain-containing protein